MMGLLGFNKALSGQCPKGHEGAEIRELFWPQNRYRRQHEHLPVSRPYYFHLSLSIGCFVFFIYIMDELIC